MSYAALVLVLVLAPAAHVAQRGGGHSGQHERLADVRLDQIAAGDHDHVVAEAKAYEGHRRYQRKRTQLPSADRGPPRAVSANMSCASLRKARSLAKVNKSLPRLKRPRALLASTAAQPATRTHLIPRELPFVAIVAAAGPDRLPLLSRNHAVLVQVKGLKVLATKIR